MNNETMVSGRGPIKNIEVTIAGGSASDGAIVDGVSSSIKATVFDYTTSNPLATTLVDTNGDPVSVGGGTQYTEDAAAAANPTGTAVNLVRQDTPAALVTTDGDNVTQRGTNYGAAYTQVVTSAGAFVDTFGGGTQYADAAARGTATGTIAMVDDGTLIQSMKGDSSGRPLVTIDTALPAGTANIGNVDIESIVGTVETGNSTTATLLSGATFTGASFDALNCASICVSAISNVASAASGLSLQFSSDGTNWDITYPYTLSAGAGRTYKLGIEARYFRVVYTNGGTGQTYFRLQTICSPVATKHFGMPIDATVLANDNAQLVKSIIAGVTTGGGGGYVDVKVSPSGTVQVGGTLDAITTLPLPTGASTSANQTTIIGHLDGVEGLLTTIDADTGVLAAIDYATGADVASLGVVGGGVEATALRVTLASDSTGLVSVDDNGGSLTVDGSVTVTQATGTNLHTVIDSGTVSTITNVVHVDDNAGSLTVDYATTGSGTATGALRVELPTNGTGVIATVGAVTAITNALPAGTNAIGKLAANSGVDIGDVDITSIATGTNAIGRVGHDITGIGHGVTTVTTAGTDVALAGSTACKRVVITAQTDNTNIIAVGATGVDATIATGTGVPLSPGDSFELEIDNLADVFIDSLVNGEGVRYTYFN